MAIKGLVGDLPTQWELTTLGEAARRGGGGIQTGPFGSQLHASDYVEDGIPSIMPQNIGDNRVRIDGIARITPEDAARLERYRVQTGDIVYSRRGDVEKRALIRSAEGGWLCGTGCLRVRFENGPVNPEYASYYLGHPSVREWVVRHAHGATMPNLNTSILSELPFVIPPLSEQRAIAHILGTLDDKIELNRRMNETLEEIARTIFTSWFVRFDPVRAKAEGRQPEGMDAETAALFPDSFVDSELGEIPTGWRIVSVGDVMELSYGKALKESNRRVGEVPVYGSNGRVGFHDEALVRGPGIVVGRKGTAGSVTRVDEDFFPIDTTFYVVINEERMPSISFAVYVLKALNLSNQAADSAVPGLNRNTAYIQKLVLPPRELVSTFECVVAPMFTTQRNNREQSALLSAIRDLLLPRLLSGELRVPACDEVGADGSDEERGQGATRQVDRLAALGY